MLNAKMTNVVSSATGFRNHNARCQLRQKTYQPVSLDALAQHDRAVTIKTGHAAGGLPKINAQDCNIHQNVRPSPLFPRQWP